MSQYGYLVLNFNSDNVSIQKASIEAAKVYCEILQKTDLHVYIQDILRQISEWENEITKQETVKDLAAIKESDQIFLTKLPKDAKSLIEFPYHELSTKTLKNLEALKEKYDIEWYKTYQYTVEQNSSRGYAYGYIIRGRICNQLLDYFRIETKNPVAGRTRIYFDDTSIQMSKLLNPVIYDLPKVCDFIEFVKYAHS